MTYRPASVITVDLLACGPAFIPVIIFFRQPLHDIDTYLPKAEVSGIYSGAIHVPSQTVQCISIIPVFLRLRFGKTGKVCPNVITAHSMPLWSQGGKFHWCRELEHRQSD